MKNPVQCLAQNKWQHYIDHCWSRCYTFPLADFCLSLLDPPKRADVFVDPEIAAIRPAAVSHVCNPSTQVWGRQVTYGQEFKMSLVNMAKPRLY